MQINDRDIIDWLLGLAAGIGALFTALYWYIWKGDRARLKSLENGYSVLEARVANAITKPEVEHIVQRVEHSFRDEHRQIIDELRDLRGEIITLIRQPWRGEERRRK